jgi:hypothetical protein
MASPSRRNDILDQLFIGILLVIFGGIVLHAPLSVGLGTLFPQADLLIKSWKELLMGVAAVCAAVILVRRRAWGLLKHPIVLLIACYAVLHVLLVPFFATNPTSVVAGLFIDLRYLLFFVLVFIAIRLYPLSRRTFLWVGLVGAGIVTAFAVLQAFLLPPDILQYLGYGPATIVPYLTVDQNMDYIRINSTLRGPNPLGAYGAIILALLVAFRIRDKMGKFKRPDVWLALLAVGSSVAIWFSYSRSALLAAVVGVVLVLLIAYRRLSKWVWISIAATVLVAGGALFALRDSAVVSTVILHEDPLEGNDVNSNQGHVDSLADGVARMARQPFGGGIGSTGSASLFGDAPLIIENQYLFIAHEVGWLGLVLFLLVFVLVLRELWRRQADWLAIGVFASGIGLALIGLLLPVWVDDTVAMVWWGLAAIAIGGTYERTIHKTTKRTA